MAVTITGSKYAGTITSVGTLTLNNSGASFISGDFSAQRIVGLWNSAGTTYKGVAWVRRWVSATQLELETQFIDKDGNTVTQTSGDSYLVSKSFADAAVGNLTVSGKLVTANDALIFGTTGSINSLCFYDEDVTIVSNAGSNAAFEFVGGLSVFGHLNRFTDRTFIKGCNLIIKGAGTGNGGGDQLKVTNAASMVWWMGGSIFSEASTAGRLVGNNGGTSSVPALWQKYWGLNVNCNFFSPNNGNAWTARAADQEVADLYSTASGQYAINLRWGDGTVKGGTFKLTGSIALSIFGSDTAGTYNIAAQAGQYINVLDNGYGTQPAFWRTAGLQTSPVQTVNLTNVNAINRKFGGIPSDFGLTPGTNPANNTTGYFNFSGLYTGLINNTLALVKNNNLLSSVQNSVTVASNQAVLTVQEAVVVGFTETVTENSWAYGFYLYGYSLIAGTFATSIVTQSAGQTAKTVVFGGFIGQVVDANISQGTVATVAAYTVLNTFDQAYDFAQYWKALNTTNAIYPAYNQQLIASNSGVLFTPTALNITIDTTVTFNATNFVNTGTGTITIKPTSAIASGTKADTLQLSAGKTLTFAQNGDKSSAIYLIPATGIVLLPSGPSNMTRSVFDLGATVNAISGSVVLTVDSSQLSKITAGTNVTITAPPILLTLTNLQTGSIAYLLNANHQPLEAGTVSGGTYTFTTGTTNGATYYYGLQKPGYLPVEQAVTGTTSSQSLTVTQQADPFYNSSYTGLTGVTITDNGASPVSYGGKSFGITVDAGGNPVVQLYSFLSFKFASTATYQGKPAYLWRRLLTTIDNQNFETARGDYYASNGTLTYKGVQVVNYDSSSASIVLDQMQSDDATYLSFCKFVITGLQSGSNVGLLSSGSVVQSATVSGSTLVLAPFFFSSSANYSVNAGLYGYLRAIANTSSATGIVGVPIAQVVDPFKVSTTPSGITAFTFNDGSTAITQTANATIQDLYDASQYRYSLLANIGLTPAVSSVDGATRSLLYDYTINTGVTLSGSGILSLPAKAFTATGTAYTAIPVISSAGLRFRVYGLPTVSGSNPVLRVKRISNSALTNPTVSATGEAFVTIALGEDYQIRADAIGYIASNFATVNSNAQSSFGFALTRILDSSGNPVYGQGVAGEKALISFDASTLTITVNYSASYPTISAYSALDKIEEILASAIGLEFTAHPLWNNGAIEFPRDIVSNAINPTVIKANASNTGIPEFLFQVIHDGYTTPYRLFDFSNGKIIRYPTTVNIAQGGSGSLTTEQAAQLAALNATLQSSGVFSENALANAPSSNGFTGLV